MAGRVGELTAHGRSMDNRPQLLQAVASSQAMTAQVVRCSASSLSIFVLLLLLILSRISVSRNPLSVLVLVVLFACLMMPLSCALNSCHTAELSLPSASPFITRPPPGPPEHQQPALLLPLLPRVDPIHLPSILQRSYCSTSPALTSYPAVAFSHTYASPHTPPGAAGVVLVAPGSPVADAHHPHLAGHVRRAAGTRRAGARALAAAAA